MICAFRERIGDGNLIERIAELIIAMFCRLFIALSAVMGIVLPTFVFLQFSKNFFERRLPELLFTFCVELELTFWPFIRDIAVPL